jgi:hypothetical protein
MVRRDARYTATGGELPSVDEALVRVLAGEPFRDLRIRMFLPARGRETSLRIGAEPLREADGTRGGRGADGARALRVGLGRATDRAPSGPSLAQREARP